MSVDYQADRTVLAVEILEIATRPNQLVQQLLLGKCSFPDIAAELEDVANRFLDLSEGLINLRQLRIMVPQD